MAILATMRNRFYNNDGTVAAGGKVYTYVAGTTTPVATYTDNTGNVPNANPIILDAKGEADIWSSSLIKVNVLQSDNTQVTGWPVDYIGSAPSIGILSYRGKWNAATNTPTLASGSGTRGYTYIVEVTGTTSIDGIATWAVEDYIAFNGTAWEKIPSGASQATSASVSAAAALASQVAAAASQSAASASQAAAAASAAAAAASAAGVNLPAITIANAAHMLRVNAGGTGYETQTPAQVLTNIGTGSYIQSQTATAFTTGGTSTAYTLTPTPAITSLVSGQRFRVNFNATAGATPTLAISGQTAKSLKLYDSTGAKVAASAATITANMLSDVEYDGTDYVILNPLPSAVVVRVRQTVLKGASSGILQIGTGLAVNLLATATPVAIAYPAGIGANGQIDYVGAFAADQASFWSGLTANVVNYLFVDRNTGTGAQTGVASTLPYIAQPSSTAISVVNGQHTYLNDTGEMYVGNGSTASVVQRVAAGECLAGAATITTVTTYSYQRRHISALTAIPGNNTSTSFSSNLGTQFDTELTGFLVNETADAGFTAGQYALGASPGGTNPVSSLAVLDRNTVAWSTGGAGFYITSRSSFGTVQATSANWKMLISHSTKW